MRRGFLAIVLVLSLTMLGRGANAAATDADAVRRSLERMVDDCRGWNAAPLYIEWTIQKTYRPSDETLKTLIAETAEAPDHPERPNVEAYVRRAAGTDPPWKTAVWFWSAEEFRYHNVSVGPRAELFKRDTTRSRSAAWDMSPTHLGLYDLASLPAHALPEAERRKFQYNISYFLYPGALALAMSAQPGQRVHFDVAMTGPATWHATGTLQPNGNTSMGFRGGWDEAHQAVRVDEAWIMLENPEERADQYLLSTKYQLKDHAEVSLASGTALVPRRVRVLNYRDEELEIRSLVALRTIDRPEFDAVTRAPSAEAPDIIYGWSDSIRMGVFDESGEFRPNSGPAAEAADAEAPVPRRATGSDRPWYVSLQYIGLGCGVIAAAIFVLRRVMVRA